VAVVPAAGIVIAVAGLAGVLAGVLVDVLAARFPAGVGRRRTAASTALLALGTGALFALTAWRFGLVGELPAFLFLAAVGVLLTDVDVRSRLLPNRIVLPSIGIGAVLLAVAALAAGEWAALLRAGLAAVVLFAVFLVLALISPRSLGMGDVKLAALIGLYLGWLGWGAVLLGAAAGFVVQAVVALVLLAARRVGWRGELPFGPAMLAGAAIVIGWPALI
jgi:leader peptidase (prepilin peptidase)/N-methyltransferase